jgi:hypothetical protein
MAATHDPGATMLQENPGAALRVFQGGAISIDGIAGIGLSGDLVGLLSGDNVNSIYDISEDDFDKIFKAIRGNLEADREFTEWRARSGVKHTIESYVDRGPIEGSLQPVAEDSVSEASSEAASGSSSVASSEAASGSPSVASSEASSVASSVASSGSPSVASSEASSVASSGASSVPPLEAVSVASSVASSGASSVASSEAASGSPSVATQVVPGVNMSNNRGRMEGGKRRTLKNRRQPPKKSRRTLGHASRISKKL